MFRPKYTMVRFVVLCVVCVLLTNQLAECAPNWLDQLFRPPGDRPYYGHQQPAASNRQPRDRFKPICRVISGDNYAFPGKVPYPSAPFCPYGDWSTFQCLGLLICFILVQIKSMVTNVSRGVNSVILLTVTNHLYINI